MSFTVVLHTKQHMLFKLEDISRVDDGRSVTRIPDLHRNEDCT